jgi:hypothetical protein
MGTRALIDPVEWDLASAQLEDILLGSDSETQARHKDAILRWHLQALAAARSEAWIPGLGGAHEPVVEEALSRFYHHHMRVTIGRLRSENLELRRKLLEAVGCVRFYATGPVDGGMRAHDVLERLDSLPDARTSLPDARTATTPRRAH